jgi:hypothetical protein
VLSDNVPGTASAFSRPRTQHDLPRIFSRSNGSQFDSGQPVKDTRNRPGLPDDPRIISATCGRVVSKPVHNHCEMWITARFLWGACGQREIRNLLTAGPCALAEAVEMLSPLETGTTLGATPGTWEELGNRSFAWVSGTGGRRQRSQATGCPGAVKPGKALHLIHGGPYLTLFGGSIFARPARRQPPEREPRWVTAGCTGQVLERLRCDGGSKRRASRHGRRRADD